MVELCIGILAGCAPTWRPLIGQWLRDSKNSQSRKAGRSYRVSGSRSAVEEIAMSRSLSQGMKRSSARSEQIDQQRLYARLPDQNGKPRAHLPHNASHCQPYLLGTIEFSIVRGSHRHRGESSSSNGFSQYDVYKWASTTPGLSTVWIAWQRRLGHGG